MKKQVISAAVLSLILLSSCGEAASQSDTNAVTLQDVVSAASGDITEPVKNEYPGKIEDYGGYTFTFLNQADDFWTGAHHILDYSEITGDSVNDAIYTRNRTAEKDLNIVINVNKQELADVYTMMSKSVAAGEDVYDAVYKPMNWGKTSFGDKEVMNLKGIPTLLFGEKWWNNEFIDQATIGDNILYTTIDYCNLMGYCYANVLSFNKSMMENLGLAAPYDLVRSGNWTYDEMLSYMKQAVNIGTDDSFKISLNGTCTYGFAFQHEEGPTAMLQGCGDYLIVKDENNNPVLRDDLTRIVNASEKLTDMLSPEGNAVMYNTADLSGLVVFLQGRAMFYHTSLGAAHSEKFRSAEFEYGLLPMPKLDPQQKQYATNISQYTFALNIPVTASDPERTGNVIDYISYLSYNDVIPVLQEALCYKGMRDDDSIEMMNLMLETETIDFGVCAGLTYDFLSKIANNELKGKKEFMSTFEKNSKAIQKNIDKLFSEG
ncbi:MAG: hypothetical protein K6D94_04285 [Clostridiales bacterium]|nr:hypothetical protein [Clostridiales bacterium]